jgi:hypothetical protein
MHIVIQHATIRHALTIVVCATRLLPHTPTPPPLSRAASVQVIVQFIAVRIGSATVCATPSVTMQPVTGTAATVPGLLPHSRAATARHFALDTGSVTATATATATARNATGMAATVIRAIMRRT